MESKILKTSWSQSYSTPWSVTFDSNTTKEIEKRIDQGDLDLANQIIEKFKK